MAASSSKPRISMRASYVARGGSSAAGLRSTGDSTTSSVCALTDSSVTPQLPRECPRPLSAGSRSWQFSVAVVVVQIPRLVLTAPANVDYRGLSTLPWTGVHGARPGYSAEPTFPLLSWLSHAASPWSTGRRMPTLLPGIARAASTTASATSSARSGATNRRRHSRRTSYRNSNGEKDGTGFRLLGGEAERAVRGRVISA